MKNCLASSEQFQKLDDKLTKEVNRLLEEVRVGHVPIFQHWIETKLECIKESKALIIQNPKLTINELAQLLDDRIENEARKLHKIKTFEEMEEICNNLSALEWTRNIVRTVDLKYRLP